MSDKTKIATIIVNRNLPNETNKLCRNIKKYNNTDIYVIESGSNKKLSRYSTWHVRDKSSVKNGLRYYNALNYALFNLYKSGKLFEYDYFFLSSNKAIVPNKQFLNKAINHFKIKKLGMVLPRSSTIAESKLVNRNQIKFLWYIDPTFIFIKKDFILKICNPKKKKEFLFDGSNFRGFMSGCELITKGYLNDFATAIVGDIQINEDHDITLSKNYLVNNETIDDAIQNYFQEGKKWLKGKYGFNTKWQMIMYSKYFYDIFFKFNKELIKFKI